MSEMMHHNNFSAADIEKYRKGQLTPAEMHALEKAALDDPFLADAMEGFGVGSIKPGAGSPENDIKELQERLRRRVEGGKLRSMAGWWKVAAAVIVVAGGIWTYKAMNSTMNSPAKNIAAKEVAKEPQPPAPAAISADTIQATANTITIPAAAQVNTKAKKDSGATIRSTLVSPAPATTAGMFRDSDLSDDTKKVAKEKNSLAKSPSKDKNIDRALEDRVSGVKTDTLQWKQVAAAPVQNTELGMNMARRQARAEAKSMPARDTVHEYKVAIRGYLNSPLNTFNGRILDKLNKPVPGASIEIPGRQQSYTTDSLGYFSFKAPDTALKVSIASIGYVQRYYTLRNSNSNGFNNNSVAMGNSNSNGIASNNANNANFFSNQVVLQQLNPSLNEVVVVGYGARKKELVSNRDEMKVTVLDAAPDTGWDEYNDYLDKNKKVPDGADDIHGSVVVRFNVDNNGTMKNFAIEKSLGDALDAEAIRLVKEGPAWHLLKGKAKKSKVTVLVRF